jgi:hypothetical protein
VDFNLNLHSLADIDQAKIGNRSRNADETIILRGGRVADQAAVIISRQIIRLQDTGNLIAWDNSTTATEIR